MLKSTRAAIAAIAATDPTVKPSQLRAAIEILEGRSIVTAVDRTPVDEVLTLEQVMGLLHVNRFTVWRYGRAGFIKRVECPGGHRSLGYTKSSVRDFIEGRRRATVA